MKTFLVRAALLVAAGTAALVSPVRAQGSPAAPPPPAALSPAKEALILRLLELTGSADMGRQVMDSLIASFRQAGSGVPDEFWERFQKEIDLDELVREVVPVYDRHFSEEELKGLVAFYEGPLGRKVMARMPEILRETMAIGQKWGKEIGERVGRRLQEEKEREKKPEGGGAP